MGTLWSERYLRNSLSFTVPDYVCKMFPHVGTMFPDRRISSGACSLEVETIAGHTADPKVLDH